MTTREKIKMSLQKYNVTGMSCAACQARVEKAVGKVPGVESVAVSLLTNSMGVEGTADPAAVISAVEKRLAKGTIRAFRAQAAKVQPGRPQRGCGSRKRRWKIRKRPSFAAV